MWNAFSRVWIKPVHFPFTTRGVDKRLLPVGRREIRTIFSGLTLAWLLWLVCIILISIHAVSFWLNIGGSIYTTYLGIQFLLLLAAFAMTGLFIALKRSTNPIGWLLLAFPLCLVTWLLAGNLLVREGSGGVSPFITAVAWFHSWGWIPVLSILPVLLLLLPTGRLLSPRWRIAVGIVVFGSLCGVAALAFGRGPIHSYLLEVSGFPAVQNPLGFVGPTLWIIGVLIFLVMLPLCLALAVISLVLRFRRARGVERRQMMWTAFGASLFVFVTLLILAVVVVFVLTGRAESNPVFINILGSVWGVSFVAVPIAILIAILRYRLLDIDFIINRTIVYSFLTAILASLYTGCLEVGDLLFTNIVDQPSRAAVIFSSFVVAFVFTPLRDTLQTFVDRSFKEVHDPVRELGAFNRELRNTLQVFDADQVTNRLLEETTNAFQARSGAVHLHCNGAYETFHSKGDATPAVTVPIVCDGYTLGDLTLGPRANDRPYSAPDNAILQECAATVGRALLLFHTNDALSNAHVTARLSFLGLHSPYTHDFSALLPLAVLKRPAPEIFQNSSMVRWVAKELDLPVFRRANERSLRRLRGALQESKRLKDERF